LKSSKLQQIRIAFQEHYSLIGILLGSALFSFSLGPYSSWDSQLEFSAAKGVVEWGFPYVTYGHLINQQPLGFYVGAVFLKIFGVSYEIAVSVTMLFALGSVFLTYKIGKMLYGKRTGLFAAALFALTPWHVIMSRVYLIDVQCLFLSLLFLLTGIYAMRKSSSKLFLVTGLIFGLALLTKVFAVFMLIPLALIYACSKPKGVRRTFEAILLFVLPAFLIQYLWYEHISALGLLSVFTHEDFSAFLPEGFGPSPFFQLNFLSEALGIFFILGFSVSIAISFLQRKHLSKILALDLSLFAAVAAVFGLCFYLVFGMNLQVPYVNSVKYTYLTLPLFCLLAASAVKKCSVVTKNRGAFGKRQEVAVYLAAIGPYLFLVSMVFNFISLTTMLKYSWLSFNVPGGLSYSFDRLAPVFGSSTLWSFQLLGFLLINLGLLWSNRSKLQTLFSVL
jgi:4-amino-4-deoxy-L-arabinose transferase-like glycosyltransferase